MYLPSIVVVALGEPGTPVVSCAITGRATSRAMVLAVSDSKIDRLCFLGGPQDFEMVEFAFSRELRRRTVRARLD